MAMKNAKTAAPFKTEESNTYLATMHLDLAKINGRVIFTDDGNEVVEFTVPVTNLPFREISELLTSHNVDRAEMYVDEMAEKIQTDSISRFLASALER